MLVLAVLALLVPVVSYAGLIYLLDLHEREPPWALALALVLGGVAASATLAVERALLAALPGTFPALSNAATLQVSCFVVIGPVEELAKLLVTLLFARRALMNEPVDGVVYAGFVSLGFAAGEGLLGARGLSATALLLRALLPLPGHVFFSALWGAALGATRHWGRALAPWLAVAFVAAALLHGAYDYLLFAEGGSLRGAVVALLACAGLLCAVLFRALLARSPFRGVTVQAGVCGACGHTHPARSRLCGACGELLAPARALPLSLRGTVGSFACQVLPLLALGMTQGLWPASARMGGQGLQQLAPLAVCLLLGALLAGARATGWLELLMASGLSALCLLLYVTLSAPALTRDTAGLMLCSILIALAVRGASRARR